MHSVFCFVLFFFLLTEYANMYIIDPGESKSVEALPHDYGLKVAVVYDAQAEKQTLMYKRWECKNESVFTVTFMDTGTETISTSGGTINGFQWWLVFYILLISIVFVLIVPSDNCFWQASSEIKVKDPEVFAQAVEALTYVPPVARSAIRR
jgi:hypothetical protein